MQLYNQVITRGFNSNKLCVYYIYNIKVLN